MRAAIVPAATGGLLILAGHVLAGALFLSITGIFWLRLLERQFTEKLLFAGRTSRHSDAISERAIDGIGTFLQQFTGSFFACIFWMTQGNLGLVTAAHWITATQTGLGAAATLQIIQQAPRLSPLMKGRWRAFFVTSIVVTSVDRCIHPGHFGGPLVEALLTGMTAYGLNMTIDGAYEVFLALFKL